MIARESIAEVMDVATVQDVISDYVRLKRAGRNLKGLCPFHNEKTPSFVVSPEKNIYKCFGCGKAGDPVRFLMDLESMSFPESVRHLAKKYGIALKEDEREEDSGFEEKESLYIINEMASKYYQTQLLETDHGQAIGLSYFKERGFLESTIKKFQLGFSTQDKEGLKNHALGEGYTSDKLDEAGLLNQYGGDFFRSRVIFPIQNASGKTVGFAGRIMDQTAKAPKYVNTRETEIYNKRMVLYGMFQAKQQIRQEDLCIIVEGYTDVMSLHQNDVRNAVAASGTSLTEEQCRLIKRFTKNVLLLFDGDNAGKKAAMRGLDIVLAQGLHPQVILLPPDEDPDSLIKKLGSTAFREHLASEAKDFILFKSDELLAETADKPIQRVRAYQDIASSIAKIRDPMTRSIYIQECATRFAIEEKLIVDEVNKFIRSELKQQRKSEMREQYRKEESQVKIYDPSLPKSAPVRDDRYQEQSLLKVVLEYGHKETEDGELLIDYVLDNIADELPRFDHGLSQRLLLEMIEARNEDKEVTAESYFSHPDEEIRLFVIGLMTSPYSYSQNWEDLLDNQMLNQRAPEENYENESNQTLLRIKMKKLGQLMDECIERLKSPLDPEAEAIEIEKLRRYRETRNHIALDLGQNVIV